MESGNDFPERVYFRKPSLIARIKSMFIDTLILIGLMLLISNVLNTLNIESGSIRGLCMVFILLYEPILVSIGGTVGHRMMGLRVKAINPLIDHKRKENINFFRSLIRYFFKIILGWISLLSIHSDDYGQALHDKAGYSVMTFK